MKQEDQELMASRASDDGRVKSSGGGRALDRELGGLELGVRKIVAFTIADARLHDALDELAAESVGAIMALVRAAFALAVTPHGAGEAE